MLSVPVLPSGPSHVPVMSTLGGLEVHGFGVQIVPAPCHMLGEMQATWAVTVQLPLAAQQAAVGWVQGLGVQVVPEPCHVLGDAQAA